MIEAWTRTPVASGIVDYLLVETELQAPTLGGSDLNLAPGLQMGNYAVATGRFRPRHWGHADCWNSEPDLPPEPFFYLLWLRSLSIVATVRFPALRRQQGAHPA